MQIHKNLLLSSKYITGSIVHNKRSSIGWLHGKWRMYHFSNPFSTWVFEKYLMDYNDTYSIKWTIYWQYTAGVIISFIVNDSEYIAPFISHKKKQGRSWLKSSFGRYFLGRTDSLIRHLTIPYCTNSFSYLHIFPNHFQYTKRPSFMLKSQFRNLSNTLTHNIHAFIPLFRHSKYLFVAPCIA